MIFFSPMRNFSVNNFQTNIPKKQMNKQNHENDSFSFGKGKNVRVKYFTLKYLAEKFHFLDFYTGLPIKNIEIEHVIPQGKNTRDRAQKIGLSGINSIGNLVLIDKITNESRKNTRLCIWYKNNPEFLDKGKAALKQYEQVNLRPDELFDGSPAINGKEWVAKLKYTLNAELGFPAFTGRKKIKNYQIF